MTEEIRSSDFDIVNRKSDRQSLSLPCGRQLPLHKGAMAGVWHGCGISAFYKGHKRGMCKGIMAAVSICRL